MSIGAISGTIKPTIILPSSKQQKQEEEAKFLEINSNAPVDKVLVSSEALKKASESSVIINDSNIATDSNVVTLMQTALSGNDTSLQQLKSLVSSSDPKVALAAQNAIQAIKAEENTDDQQETETNELDNTQTNTDDNMNSQKVNTNQRGISAYQNTTYENQA